MVFLHYGMFAQYNNTIDVQFNKRFFLCMPHRRNLATLLNGKAIKMFHLMSLIFSHKRPRVS